MDELDLLKLKEAADPYHLADKNEAENRSFSAGTLEERRAKVKDLNQMMQKADDIYRKICDRPDDYSLSTEERAKAIIQVNKITAIKIDLVRKIAYADPDLELDFEALKASCDNTNSVYAIGPRGGFYEIKSGKNGVYKQYR